MIPWNDVKLLIVDLDNTLCDTFHTLSLKQWERVEERLKEEGCDLSMQELKENFGKHSFRDTLAAAELAPNLMEIALRVYDDVDISTLKLFDDANEFLAIPLPKVLLSRGEAKLQKRKIDHLGIRNHVEEVVIVPTFDTKKASLAAIMEKYELPPSSCLVVGDRLLEEIKDGSDLGMWTVLVHRSENPVPESDISPSLTVQSLSEITSQFRRHL